MSKRITLLGSTGSIGTQSLDVIRAQGYEVFGLAANRSADLLLRQIAEFRPKAVAVVDAAAAQRVKSGIAGMSGAPLLLEGEKGLAELAAMPGAEIVLNAVVGVAGLAPTLAAIESGKDLALANKESLVTGGALVTDAVRRKGVQLLPVDSEHSAIFQCLQDRHSAARLTKILLTASGGPFFGRTAAQLQSVTAADALRHPNWSMGSKITVDSASLMNKGLELIEAVWLFGLPPEKVQIVVQRQSIIHSMVQFADNSVLAQLGVPDMRIPIQYALTWPDRTPGPAPELDFTTLGTLTFDVADEEAFRCLAAAKRAIALGGLVPAALNGANEKAVELFLQGRIGFLEIGRMAELAVERFASATGTYTVQDVFACDAQARRMVEEQAS
ncbi:1-deoxy-D-xylulose-5-phosphate reductoisomerase [Anaerofilum sp. BX8]|uniref:1-deoxy-D-xylulose 5-phosphate reductoisomerase n=1 Tax=Anaerofilum hominis TaxID=2763016 RepID=A0A923KX49_9FIRM|nr:1-deoxy-D-xylulose-5-phosphate reductoisomerase [Anaerofilum hominis]MBC5580044.1 1-deoxy-D-xylulose-5-phosphate reductoisomerase [Anaerofilum hominis]